MEVPMYPILFSVGPYPIYSYGVCVLLGVQARWAVGARSMSSRWRSACWWARSLARG
jgi:prolipoprotein diacylglyceryltransferase